MMYSKAQELLNYTQNPLNFENYSKLERLEIIYLTLHFLRNGSIDMESLYKEIQKMYFDLNGGEDEQ